MSLFQYGMLVQGLTNTATAAGTTTLTLTSTQIQVFTGSTTQTVKLPATTGMAAGQFFEIYNSSTGALTIQFQDATSFTPNPTVAAGASLIVKLSSTGTTNGTWVVFSATSVGFANPMTTLGDIIYGGTSGTATRLAGSTSATLAVLTQTGTGSASAAPVWTASTGTGNVVRATGPSMGNITVTPSTTGGGVIMNRDGSGATNGDSWGMFLQNAGATDNGLLAMSSSTFSTGGLAWVGNSVFYLYYPSANGFKIGTGSGSTAALAFDSSLGATFGGAVTATTTGSQHSFGSTADPGSAKSVFTIQGSTTGYTNALGLFVKAGTSSSDFSLVVANAANSVNYLVINGAGTATFGGTVLMQGTSGATIGIGGTANNSNGQMLMNGSSASGQGAFITFQSAGSTIGGIGRAGAAQGTTSNDLLLDSNSNNIKFLSGGSLALTLDTSQNATFAGSAGINGTLAIGTTPVTGSALYILSTNLTGAAQTGLQLNPTFTSSGTSLLFGIRSNIATQATAFTAAFATDFAALAAVIGAGSTITNHVGFFCSATGGTNVSQISDNQTATGQWFINQSGTAASSFGGPVLTQKNVGFQGYQTNTPTTGTTVAMTDSTPGVLFTPATTIAALTVKLPPTPVDGQKVFLGTSQQITALTMQDGAGGSTALAFTGTNIVSPGRFLDFLFLGGKWYYNNS